MLFNFPKSVFAFVLSFCILFFSSVLFAINENSNAIQRDNVKSTTFDNILDDHGDTLLRWSGINERDRYGSTLLMCASKAGHVETVRQLLINKKIDPNIKDHNGNTALILATIKGHAEVVTQLLADSRTDPYVKDKYGNTVLMVASLRGYIAVVKKLLIDNRIYLNAQGKHCCTALILAAAEGHVAVVAKLLADPRMTLNVPTNNGSTALMLAASKGYFEILKNLLESGVKAEPVAVTFAENIGCEKCVELLEQYLSNNWQN